MHPWDWDEDGGYWFNRDTREVLTPQELWIMNSENLRRIEKLERWKRKALQLIPELEVLALGEPITLDDIQRAREIAATYES